MLNEKISKLINEQINKELYSAYLYLDISNYYAERGLTGFQNWFKVQTQEERDHAMLFIQYLQNNGDKVVLQSIDQPNKLFTGLRAPLEVSLEHELYVTSLIHGIYSSATEEKDYRTMQLLDWFVKEQGEEEMNIDNLIKKVDLFGSDPKGLYMIDQELANRMYNPPTLIL